MIKKSHIIIISGIIKTKYVKSKCDDLIKSMEPMNNKMFDNRIYLDLYEDNYQDEDCTGIGIRIVKPTKTQLDKTLRLLKSNIKEIFDEKLVVLVKADNLKIY